MFLILVVVTTLYLTKYVIDYSFIMDQISLASGVASIILAIVAIIYAFFQSYESGKQSESLQDLLSQVSRKVEEIGPLKQEVADTKQEVKRSLMELQGSLASSYQQFDSQVKEKGQDLGSKAGEIYKSFFNNYIQNAIKEVNEQPQTVTRDLKKMQDFHVILTTQNFKEKRELNDQTAVEYIKYFREKSSIGAIASNIVIFSDYTGVSFTLSFFEDKQWSAKEVQNVIGNYHIQGLSVFTVAKLIY